MNTCKHPDGCHRPALKTRGGWCRMHGARIARNGNPGPPDPYTKRRQPKDQYGDNTYTGNGGLICRFCNTPLRDHSITRPCIPIGTPV